MISKKTITFIIAVIALLHQVSYAQTNINAILERQLHIAPNSVYTTTQLVQMLNARNHNNNSTARTTSTQSRLVASSFYTYNGTQYIPQTGDDSCNYYYTGNRGGDLAHTIKYDTLLYLGTPSYENAALLTQNFDVNNNIILQLDQPWDSATGSWVNNNQYLWIYDIANNAELSQTFQFWNDTTSVWVNNNKDTIYYNVSGKDSIQLAYSWSGGAWTNTDMFLYYYNSSGYQDSFVIDTWNASASAWHEAGRYLFFYDGSGNEDTLLYQYNPSDTGWTTDFQDIYIYNSIGQVTTNIFMDWNASANAWENQSSESYYYASGNAVIESNAIWNSTNSVWDSTTQAINTYNSFNQLTSATELTWDTTTFSWQLANGNYLDYYYYQDYTSAVSTVTPPQGSFKAYPVPASDRLNVDVELPAPQAMDVVIYDMLGNVVKQWRTPVCAQYHTEVPLHSLASGMYIIQVKSDKGRMQQEFSVVK